ncbi:hypothetical protein HELRODRAFT_190274 [Helobdella robusta]|uniref:RING-type domain-containing protein n=1 Tax=Helobdella robusta TaxID=6412 RepID=T1FRU7_HELRO|nr:hypothetical protein HELRODRAFT_190274 [Helobdella robusta]ESO11017.1 hypothetical protein HELRODRAFT_190274 [Helobdella robusta]
MLIHCIICTEVISYGQNVSAVPCGHVFHEQCLTRWFGSSLTCPQCRNKRELQNKEMDYLEIVCEKHELETKLQSLVEKHKKVVDNLSEEKSKNGCLTEQLKYHEALTKELESSNQMVNALKEQLEVYKNVQYAVNGVEDEVKEMVNECVDRNQLGTWCCLFKKELERKKMDLRLSLDTIKKLRKELDDVKKHLENKTKMIQTMEGENVMNEETIVQQDEEIKSLKKKLTALQAAISSPRPTTSSLVHRLLYESPCNLNLTCDDLLKSPGLSKKRKYDEDNNNNGYVNNSNNNNNNSNNNKRNDSESDDNLSDCRNYLRVSENDVSVVVCPDDDAYKGDDDGDDNRRQNNNNNNKVNGNNNNNIKITLNKKNSKNNISNNKSAKLREHNSDILMSIQIFNTRSLQWGGKKIMASSSAGTVNNRQISSSSSSTSSSSMVMRKGYNGLGGHDKFVAPLPKYSYNNNNNNNTNNKNKNNDYNKNACGSNDVTKNKPGKSIVIKYLAPSTSTSSSAALLNNFPVLCDFDDLIL